MRSDLLSWLLALLALSSLCGEARPAEQAWQGSIRMKLKVVVAGKRPRSATHTVSDATLSATPDAFALELPDNGVLAGKARATRRSLRLAVSPGEDAEQWTRAVLMTAVALDVTVSRVSGTGVAGSKKAQLILQFKGSDSRGRSIRGRLSLSSVALRPLVSVPAAIIAPTGGTVDDAVAGTVTVGPGFFSAPSSVTFAYQSSALSAPIDTRTLPGTMLVSFDTASLDTTDPAASATLVPPWNHAAKREKAQSAAPDTLMRVKVTTFDSGGRYLESTVAYARELDPVQLTLDYLRTTFHNFQSAFTVRTEVNRVESSSLYGSKFGVGLWHWDETLNKFIEVDLRGPVVPGIDGGRIIALMHGWEVLPDNVRDQPQIEHWKAFLQWALVDGNSPRAAEDRAAMEFYSVRYDSKSRTVDNAVDLHNMLAQVFQHRHVDVGGYSMGGLIAHIIKQRFYPGGRRSYAAWDQGGVDHVFTLDAPLHGSPLIQALQGQANCTTHVPLLDGFFAFLLVPTEGARDLRWDGMDGGSIGDLNTDLKALNQLSAGVLSDYRGISATMSPLTTSHGFFYYELEPLMESCGAEYVGDGVVPAVSSRLADFTTPAWSPRITVVPTPYATGLDHGQVAQGRFSPGPDPAHFENILAQLRLATSPPPPPPPPVVPAPPADPGTTASTLLYENFEASQLQADWTTSGNRVYLADGILWVTGESMGNGGKASGTQSLTIDPTKKVIVERAVFVHATDHHARPSISLIFAGTPRCGVTYSDYATGDSTSSAYTGFFAWGDDQHRRYPQSDAQGALAAAKWDSWFVERLEYDGVIGEVKWFMDNQYMGKVSTTTISQSSGVALQVGLDAYGWNTGYRHGSSFLRVSQAPRN
jgi:hypothetical protein